MWLFSYDFKHSGGFVILKTKSELHWLSGAPNLNYEKKYDPSEKP